MSEDENDEIVSDDWADAMEEQSDSESGAEADWGDALAEQSEAENLESAQFNELEQPEDKPVKTDISADDLKLDIILDVPVIISMEIGRTKINIRNLLQLNQGSVIELDRFAGEPMDVLVNGTLIAHGEVVVVNDKFGIRLTDVVSPTDRVKKLG
ncbi:MAG: flagellar motor switch protein FliN [Methylococcaceae bacterium]